MKLRFAIACAAIISSQAFAANSGDTLTNTDNISEGYTGENLKSLFKGSNNYSFGSMGQDDSSTSQSSQIADTAIVAKKAQLTNVMVTDPNGTSSCDASNLGQVRFNMQTEAFEVCKAGGWTATEFGSSSAGGKSCYIGAAKGESRIMAKYYVPYLFKENGTSIQYYKYGKENIKINVQSPGTEVPAGYSKSAFESYTRPHGHVARWTTKEMPDCHGGGDSSTSCQNVTPYDVSHIASCNDGVWDYAFKGKGLHRI